MTLRHRRYTLGDLATVYKKLRADGVTKVSQKDWERIVASVPVERSKRVHRSKRKSVQQAAPSSLSQSKSVPAPKGVSERASASASASAKHTTGRIERAARKKLQSKNPEVS